jgi:hypothetical protein
MYLSLRQYQVELARVDEIIQRVQSTFVPVISQSPGFVSFYAVDMGEGRIMSISVFQDKAGAENSARLSADHIRRNLAELFPNAPVVSGGEIRILALAHSARHHD